MSRLSHTIHSTASLTRRLRDTLGPLVGIHRDRTVNGLVVFVFVIVLVTAAEVLPRLLLFDNQNVGLAGYFDTLIGLAIFVAVLTNVIAIVYAAWNAGPGLAFLFPITPLVVGWLFGGRITVEVDLAVALASATLAASIATFRNVQYVTTTDDATYLSAIEGGLAITSAGTILAGVVIWRVAAVTGPHTTSGLFVAGILLATAAALLVLFLVLYGYFSYTDTDQQQLSRQ